MKEKKGNKPQDEGNDQTNLSLAIKLDRNNQLIKIADALVGLVALNKEAGGAEQAAFKKPILPCKTNTTVSGVGEKVERKSSLDFRANDQKVCEAEAQKSAEAAAKESALQDAIDRAMNIECDDGCLPVIDDRSVKYKKIISQATGMKDPVPNPLPKGPALISCRWGWEAKFKATIGFKCVKPK